MRIYPSFLFSRQFGLFSLLVGITLFIGVFGPSIAFGGVTPLASIAARVVCIVLLVFTSLMVLARGPLVWVIVPWLCLLLWRGLPWLHIGNSTPFASWMARFGVIAAVVGVCLLYTGWRLLQRLRSDPSFAERVLQNNTTSTGDEQVGSLDFQMKAVLRQQRNIQHRGWGGLRRRLWTLRSSEDMPWWLTVGWPGSGKTNALSRAGLSYLSSHELSSECSPLISWHLTDQAVLVDIAGDVIRHDLNLTDDALSRDRRTGDSALWRQLLDLLRRYRPRRPINGVLIMLDTPQLDGAATPGHLAHATTLRTRLSELAQQLGIEIPVYVMVTKVDHLAGFNDYFHALTDDERDQPWGFVLPYAPGTIRDHCTQEMSLLVDRLSEGVNRRLHDEHELTTRRSLTALPEAFASLTDSITGWVERIFGGSQSAGAPRATLRGVYFTSALQTGGRAVAEPYTVMHRVLALTQLQPPSLPSPRQSHSFFLHHLLTRIVLNEASVAAPNLQWERHARLRHLLGHVLAIVLFGGCTIGIWTSLKHNETYLHSVQQRAGELAVATNTIPISPSLQDTLTKVRQLPAYPGMDPVDPPADWRFGLNVARAISAESSAAYERLQKRDLLPLIVRRLEDKLADATARHDSAATYDTLRTYLMFYNPARYRGSDVRSWLGRYGVETGGQSDDLTHAIGLLNDKEIVQSPLQRNETLITQARTLLNESSESERLYWRMLRTLSTQAPGVFSLAHDIGPHASAVFRRNSGRPLDEGIPGLFTKEGYHVVQVQLDGVIHQARDEDWWVLSDTSPSSRATESDDAIAERVSELYLREYARQWDEYLDDIRLADSANLDIDLQHAQDLTAKTSPLQHLIVAAAHQTTLTDSKLDNIASTQQAERRLAYTLVDEHFAALHALVGDKDSKGTSGGDGGDIEAVGRTINDYASALSQAGNAIASGQLPAASTTTTQLELTADRLPPPLRNMLHQLVADSTRHLTRATGETLSRQLEEDIGAVCRETIHGKYPFARESSQDLSLDDFGRLFAPGGVIDTFYNQHLAARVDTSAQPWRYRHPPGEHAGVYGPDLRPFQQARIIRDLFFPSPDAKQPVWRGDMTIVELDPAITTLSIDLDGTIIRYQHGPVIPYHLTWPGSQRGQHASITATDHHAVDAIGPWAWFHLLDQGKMLPSPMPGHTRVAWDWDGHRAVIDLSANVSDESPIGTLRSFRCPRIIK